MPTDTSYPFVTQQDLSDYLGRDVTTDDGALACVDAACQFCRDIAEQHFNKVTNDTIHLDGTGTDVLLLPEVPVTKIGAVAVTSSAGEATTLDATDYLLGANGTLFAMPTGTTGCSVWTLGRQNIAVTYDHGYTDVPRSVRMVALSVASRLLVQGPAAQETVGPTSVRYGTNASDFTVGELAILRKYRRAT